MDQDELTRRRQDADKLIKNYVLIAVGTGFIPVPLVDVVAIASLEVSMIGDMARIYAFPYPGKLVALKLLISLAGSIGPVYLSGHLLSTLKGLPLPGYLALSGLMSITGGVSVYAVGKVFQKHFESGGTFLSGKNAAIRALFNMHYAEGKTVVPELAGRA